MVRPSVSAGGRPPAVGAAARRASAGAAPSFQYNKVRVEKQLLFRPFYTVPQYFTGAERRSASVK